MATMRISAPGTSARDLGQAVPHQRAAGDGAHRDQAHQAVGELQHLQRLGVLDELADVGGDALLGADHLVDGEAVGPASGCRRRTRGCGCARCVVGT